MPVSTDQGSLAAAQAVSAAFVASLDLSAARSARKAWTSPNAVAEAPGQALPMFDPVLVTLAEDVNVDDAAPHTLGLFATEMAVTVAWLANASNEAEVP